MLAEALDDVVVRLPQLRASDVSGMLADLRHQSLVHGFRHLPPVDTPTVASTIESFSEFVREAGDLFEAVDLNPLIVGSDGSATVVDMLVIVRDAVVAPTEG